MPDCAGPPDVKPIGLELTRVAKAVSRAFDEALAAAGGSLPTWLVLVSVMSGRHGNQREIAEAIGIEGPTLTHHLNRMETDGLLTRTRDPQNRRTHRVELSPDGAAAFSDLVQVVTAFDQRLRAGFSERDLATLRSLLERLAANASAHAENAPT
jgi:MarR family transcriptional regulator, transcriptional regulator for hemolysin